MEKQGWVFKFFKVERTIFHNNILKRIYKPDQTLQTERQILKFSFISLISFIARDHTRNLWFSSRNGEKVVQNFSISQLTSPVPPTTSRNFFLSGASFIATCNFDAKISIFKGAMELKRFRKCNPAWHPFLQITNYECKHWGKKCQEGNYLVCEYIWEQLSQLSKLCNNIHKFFGLQMVLQVQRIYITSNFSYLKTKFTCLEYSD